MSEALPGLRIQTLQTPAEIAQVEELQRAVWPGNDIEVVPAHLLLTVAHNGGLVAGAWVDDRLTGFVFGFAGFDERAHPPRLKHCSHMLGVHPDYRNSGVGFLLKKFQWEFTRQQGIELVTWTYDPLLARNARLNIAKLGAVCSTYLRDVYGVLRDGLNAGLPSDRFQVDWWVSSARVTDHMGGLAADPMPDRLALVNPPAVEGFPSPPTPPFGLSAGASAVLLEIPPDFLALKATDPSLARTWRMGTRAAFETLFGKGYAVTGFVRKDGRCIYVLERDDERNDRSGA